MRSFRWLPAPIRRIMKRMVILPVRDWQTQRAEAALPMVELTPRHIGTLKVLVDRPALLEALPKAGTVAEVGVAQGDFSEQILARTLPTTLHLIDVWAGDPRYRDLRAQVESRFAQPIAAGQVVIHQGRSTEVLAKFPDRYFDWVYLDSAHDYATVAQELALCCHKVRAGGLIAGHDYTKGSWRGWIRYGTIEAVNEFCVRAGWSMVLLTHESHRHLSYVLRELPREGQ